MHTITDKTQVSFRQFAWGDFHAHLLASLTLISMKKNYSSIARRKNIPFYYIATDEIPEFFLSLKKSSRAVKILFLSFTCEDIGVAMVTNINFDFLEQKIISIIVFISP